MNRARSIVTLVLAAAVLVTPASSLFAQTCEELEKKVADLTRRLEALESRAEAPKAAAAPRPRVNASQGRQAALALYDKIDGLVATGNFEQAKRELAGFNEEHAGTPTADWTRSLTRELAVVGKPAPENWSIEKWYQGESEIDLDGSRPTLVVFWESWCPHCKSEVPKLQKVYDDYRGKGLQVLGVTRLTRSATEESARSFLADAGVSYPIAKETGDLAAHFNVKGIPAAAMVKDGRIVWRGHPLRVTDELLQYWF